VGSGAVVRLFLPSHDTCCICYKLHSCVCLRPGMPKWLYRPHSICKDLQIPLQLLQGGHLLMMH
jgi:hypothetical protein